MQPTARRRSPLPSVRNFFSGIIRNKHRALWLGANGGALLPGSCTYGDFGNIDNPLVRRTQWFSYLRGEDIEAACTEGSAERYRLIYNAHFRSQVRAYEVTADGSGGAFYVARAVPNGAALSNFTFLPTAGWWRWDVSEAVMSAEMFDDLRFRLGEDDYFDRSGARVRLSSFEYYWLVTACVDGKFESRPAAGFSEEKSNTSVRVHPELPTELESDASGENLRSSRREDRAVAGGPGHRVVRCLPIRLPVNVSSETVLCNM